MGFFISFLKKDTNVWFIQVEVKMEYVQIHLTLCVGYNSPVPAFIISVVNCDLYPCHGKLDVNKPACSLLQLTFDFLELTEVLVIKVPRL